MRIHAFCIKESCELKTLTLNISPILPHPRNFQTSYQSYSSAASLPQAWSCPVLLWEGWSVFWSFQLAAEFPLLFLSSSREGVVVVTAISSIVHPYMGNTGSQMTGFPCDLNVCERKIFLCSITTGRMEEWGGISILTCTWVEME